MISATAHINACQGLLTLFIPRKVWEVKMSRNTCCIRTWGLILVHSAQCTKEMVTEQGVHEGYKNKISSFENALLAAIW